MPIKTVFLSLLVVCCSAGAFAQEGYAVPPPTPTRLFYIQHSHNQNTYVYDANMENGSISDDNPVNAYRILFAEGGEKKPLTNIQRKMAYGMNVRVKQKNSFEMNLAASDRLTFYLVMDGKGKPVVYVTVNNRKMYLDRMYIKIKDGSFALKVKADFVLFTGRDFGTGEVVTEKVVPKG